MTCSPVLSLLTVLGLAVVILGPLWGVLYGAPLARRWWHERRMAKQIGAAHADAIAAASRINAAAYLAEEEMVREAQRHLRDAGRV